MFEKIGFILLSFFIAYLAFQGLLLLFKDYGLEFSVGESLFLSENKGKEWIAIKPPVRGEVRGLELTFSSEDPESLYLASPKGILQSQNKGQRFRKITTEFKTEAKPIFIKELIFSPYDPETVYLVDEEIGKNKVLVSYDGGESFEPIFISQKDDKVTAFSLDPFLERFLFIGTKRGTFLKSEDFGTSWRKKQNFSQKVGQILLNPYKKEEIFLLLEAVERDPFDYWSLPLPAKVIISEDGGETFVKLEERFDISEVKENQGAFPEIKKITFDPTFDRVYFISDHFLLRGERGKIKVIKGIHPRAKSKITEFTIDPKNSNILYLGVEELIYKSENGGEDWQVIELPDEGRVKKIEINPQDPDMILLTLEKIL